jgi:hypothetical protein
MTTARNNEFMPSASHLGVRKMPIITGSAREIMKIKIEPAELLLLMAEMALLEDDVKEKEVYKKASHIIKRYPDTVKASAVIKRLGAMNDMMEDPRMRAWAKNGTDPDTTYTDDAVIRATALCPLKAHGESLYFDPDEFFRIVLEHSQGDAEA